MKAKCLTILCTLAVGLAAGAAVAGKAERDMKKKISKETLEPTTATLKGIVNL